MDTNNYFTYRLQQLTMSLLHFDIYFNAQDVLKYQYQGPPKVSNLKKDSYLYFS